MPNDQLSDAEGKDILRKWPTRGKRLWGTPPSGGWWLQAQPKPNAGAVAGPTINNVGATTNRIQPDGLWAYLEPNFADVVCVEVCGSAQNLNDKRSRYGLFQQALMLTCPLPWLGENIRVRGGGQWPRWRATGTIASAPAVEMVLPVRFLRVLYAVPNAIYKEWKTNNIPGPHEFFCPHSSFGSYTGQKMQKFLRRMSPGVHFYV